MARKKKSKTQPRVIKFIIGGLLVAGMSFAAGYGIIHLFRKADYFKVQSVVIDSSLQFIHKKDLKGLIGKSIFEVDLNTVQRGLSYTYPQASELKVMKRFPNRIAVIARQRLPFARIQVKGGTVISDKEGVVLSVQEKGDKDLPLIVGAKLDNQNLVRGLPFRGGDVRTALEIANLFQANTRLSSYSIAELNIENLSKIHFTLSNRLKVIADRSKIAQKIRVLGVVLSSGKLDLKRVKYIDLRFKEPIVGKK